jgi:hypothetical protein
MSRVASVCGVNSVSAALDSRQQMDFCMNKRMGRFRASSLGGTTMAGMATSTRLYTVEFVAIESGAGVSKKFTPRRSGREFAPIGSGKNWTAQIAPTHYS